MQHQILLFYKYLYLDDTGAVKQFQQNLCQKLNLKGRIIIAEEGINATVEGITKNTEKYIKELIKDSRFADIHFKKSSGIGNAFPKLSIKVRPEIVASHLGYNDTDLIKISGQHITPETLYSWIRSHKKFFIIDMRNDYEQKSGYFQNSILSKFENFYDLPKILPQIKNLNNEIIVTVCTGGVRCEKASGFLLNNGFKKVYQLDGGIHSYIEKYPNQDFLGKLYVFDNRLVMGFNTDDPKHQIVGRCDKCQKPCEIYVNCAYDLCHRHYICCSSCREENGLSYCNLNCAKNGFIFSQNHHQQSNNTTQSNHHIIG